MLILDNITIIICAVLIVLAVLSVLTDTFLKKLSVEENTGYGNEGDPVSVIIISDNNARELEQNLESFLTQDYASGYEVIVVVSKDEDGTGDVLKRFSHFKELYTTFVPTTSRYMSIRKLAVTLGVKAAKNEWILLTDADCRPNSDKWIASMASRRGENTDMVIGYSNYSDETSKFRVFKRLHNEYHFLREACNGVAYGTWGCNLMFRKSMFMKGNGFLGNLKFLRGEYEFLVNKYAADDNVAVDISSDGSLVEKTPNNKEWKNKNMFYVETRKHLQRRFAHCAAFNADMLSLYLCLFASVGSAVYSVAYGRWIILPFSFLALVLPFITRTLCAKKAFRLFKADIPLWKIIPFELNMALNNMKYALKYRFSDKFDFISHKS